MGTTVPGVLDWLQVSLLAPAAPKYQAGLAGSRLSESEVCVCVCV